MSDFQRIVTADPDGIRIATRANEGSIEARGMLRAIHKHGDVEEGLRAFHGNAEIFKRGYDFNAPQARGYADFICKFEAWLQEDDKHMENNNYAIRSIPRVSPSLEEKSTQATPKNDLQTFRALDGRRVNCYRNNQRIADYGENKSPLSLEEIGGAMAAILTGNAGGYRAEVRALSEGVNTSGGFLVPSTIAATVIDAARAKSQLLALGARTIAMDSERMTIARLASDPTISPVAENATIPSSDLAFDSIAFTARKHAVLVPCSRELLEDASNAGEIVIDALTKAMASKLDTLVLSGNGGGDGWNGLLSDDRIDETASVGPINYDDVLTALNEVANLEGEATAMLAHPDVYHALSILKTATELQYLAPPERYNALMKKDSTKIANTYALLGDFSQVLIALRGDIQVDMSLDAGFSEHQALFKVVMRGDSNIARPFFHRLAGLTY